jgi:hypothetical protein
VNHTTKSGATLERITLLLKSWIYLLLDTAPQTKRAIRKTVLIFNPWQIYAAFARNGPCVGQSLNQHPDDLQILGAEQNRRIVPFHGRSGCPSPTVRLHRSMLMTMNCYT